MEYFYTIIIGYLIGSISPSIIISKYFSGIDIKKHGSGNAGGTNMLRVFGWKIAVPVMLFDIFKSYFSVLFIPVIILSLTNLSNTETNIILLKIFGGSAAVIGHIWTIFGNFKGGKGVATSIGFMLALAPIEFLFSSITFIIVIGFSRYVSLSSIFGSITFFLAFLFRKYILNSSIDGFEYIIWVAFAIPILIIFTHRTNIKRLIDGKENKILSFRGGTHPPKNGN